MAFTIPARLMQKPFKTLREEPFGETFLYIHTMAKAGKFSYIRCYCVVKAIVAVYPANGPREALDDLALVENGYLTVWNAQGVWRKQVITRMLGLVRREVSSELEHAPNRLGSRGMTRVRKDDAQIEGRVDYSTRLAEAIEELHGALVRAGHELAEDHVTRGVSPVVPRLAITVEVVEYAPGVVDVHVPEAVAVVPCAGLPHAAGVAQIGGERLDLCLREAVALVEAGVERRGDHKIVEIRED